MASAIKNAKKHCNRNAFFDTFSAIFCMFDKVIFYFLSNKTNFHFKRYNYLKKFVGCFQTIFLLI